MIKIIDKIISKTHFISNYELENEFKKAGILRILTGIIIFVRFFEIFISQIYLTGYSMPAFILAAFLVLTFMFTIGSLTPIVNLILMLSMPILDGVYKTNTLGTTIAVNLLIVNFLINSGQYFSLDKFLISKNNTLSHYLVTPYKIIGTPDETEIRRAYFLGFVLYAISSLFALFLHAQDPYWLDGVTVKSMLTNTFLCKHALWFRQIELSIPYLLDIVSVFAIILQSIFQILMLLLVFTKWGRVFIKTWGFIFFGFSLLLLSLSYLPHLEIILWVLIFCPLKTPIEKIKILYDDKCNLCKNALRVFKLININKGYQFLPISKNQEYYQNYQLTELEVKTFMVGFENEKKYVGFDLYLLIIKKNPIIGFLYPIFVIGKYTKIGYWVYNYIAQNRYKVFGTCELSYDDEVQKDTSFVQLKINHTSQKIIYSTYFVLIVIYISINNPIFCNVFKNNKTITSSGKNYLKYCKHIGIEMPNVFNNVDLSMGDNFMTIKKRVYNTWQLIPVNGLHGERLNYLNFDILLFSNNNSDALYFGQILKYRRKLIFEIDSVVKFHEEGFGREHVNFLIRYDYAVSKLKVPAEYKIEVFKTNASKAKLFIEDTQRYTATKIYEKNILFNNNTK